MFISLGFCIAFGLIFFVVGQILLTSMRFDAGIYQLPISILTGLCILALFGAWSAYLALNPLVIVFAIMAVWLGFQNRSRLQKTAESLNLQIFRKPSRLFASICSLIFIFLVQNTYFGNEIAYRVGPDAFGWNAAVRYFREHSNLKPLFNSVETQLKGQSIYDALNIAHKSSNLAIDQIPSFTNQVQAEFLIGAHRTGVPFVLGMFSRMFPEGYLINIVIGFIALSFFVLALFVYIFLYNKNGKKLLSFLFATGITFSSNFISQGLEGGFGQIYITPFVIGTVIIFLERKSTFREVFLLISIFISLALTSYLDSIFLFGPLFAVLLIYRRLGIGSLFKEFHKFRIPILLMLISLGPIFTSIPRLIISPLLHPSLGGWDQGRHPLPSDVLGFTSWLPISGERIAGPRTTLYLVFVLITSSILVAYGLLVLMRMERIIFIGILVTYCYLYYSTYFNSLGNNNYRLWKFGAYAGIIFPLILVRQHFSPQESRSSNIDLSVKVGNRKLFDIFTLLVRKTNYFLILILFFTNLLWIHGWMGTRSFSVDAHDQHYFKINADKFDFVVADDIYSTMLTMYGDIHYGTKSRGGGRTTQLSTPPRPRAFVVQKNEKCLALDCFQEKYPSAVSGITVTKIVSLHAFKIVETEFRPKG